jgi:hypothetical protein
LQLNITAEEMAERRERWEPPAPRYTRGVLAKYAKLVSTSSLGAVTDLNLPTRPRHSINELVAGITDENVHPETDWGPPVGREVW